MVVGSDAAANVLDRVQAESVHAQVDPFVGRGGQVQERGIAVGRRGIAVVQVRHPVAEAAHVVQGFRGHVRELELVAAVAGEAHVGAFRHQVHRLPLRNRAVTGSPELGIIPAHIFAHQDAPRTVDVHHQIVSAVSLVHELDCLVSRPVPHIQVPTGGAVRHGFGGLGDGQLRRAGSRLLPFGGLIPRPLQHRELGIVRRGIGAKEIVVAVRGGGIGQGLHEPGVVLAGMVQDIVHVDLDVLGMGRVDQVLEVLLRAEQRVHGIVIIHVITVIGGRLLRRRQPQRRRAHLVQVVQLVLDALEVAHAVAVAVGEGIDEQLVGRGRALVAIEAVGVRHDRDDVLPLLGHGDRDGARPLDGNRTGAVLARVSVDLHRQVGLAGAGGFLHMDPGGGRRGRPVLFGRDVHEFARGVLGFELERGGAHCQGVLRLLLVLRRVAGEEDQQRGQGGQDGDESPFHKAVFVFEIPGQAGNDGYLASRGPVRGPGPKKVIQ